MFRNRRFCLVCTLFFAFWIIGGVLAVIIDIPLSNPSVEQAGDDAVDYFLKLFDHPLVNILANNFLYGLSIVAFGMLSYGAIPALGFIYNGFILGLMIKIAISSGVAFRSVLLNLLHAPVEIFAFCALAAMGLIFLRNHRTMTLKEFCKSLIMPLLCIVVAAVIEYGSYLAFNIVSEK